MKAYNMQYAINISYKHKYAFGNKTYKFQVYTWHAVSYSNSPWSVGNRCPMYKVSTKICSTFCFAVKLIRKCQNCLSFVRCKTSCKKSNKTVLCIPTLFSIRKLD